MCMMVILEYFNNHWTLFKLSQMAALDKERLWIKMRDETMGRINMKS